MADFSPKEEERIHAAFQAHQDAKKNLTVAGFARAGGVKWETARKFCLKWGYTPGSEETVAAVQAAKVREAAPAVASDAPSDAPAPSVPQPEPASPAVDPPAPDPAPAGPAPPTPAAVSPQGPSLPPSNPPVPPPTTDPRPTSPPGAKAASPAPTAPPPEMKGVVEQMKAMSAQLDSLKDLPKLIAEAVGGVVREVVATAGKDPAELARTAAASALTTKVTEHTVALSSEILANDVDVGEAIRRVWENHRGEAVTPTELFQSCYRFWMKHRDSIPDLEDENEQLRESLAYMESLVSLDAVLRRNEDSVMQVALALMANGKRMSPALLAEMLAEARKHARAWAADAPNPLVLPAGATRGS